MNDSVHITERVLDILEWGELLDQLANRCSTGPGKAYAASITPLPRADIQRQLRKITQLKGLIGRHAPIDFAAVEDIAESLEISRRGGVLSVAALGAIRNVIIASRRIIEYLRNHRDEAAALDEERERLSPCSGPGDVIIRAITEYGELNEKAYPQLKRLRRGMHLAKLDIEKKLQTMINNPHMANHLQEKIITTRGERYVLLVKSSARGNVKGTVHDSSASGQTLYLEPEAITPLNNQLRMMELELQVEINRILEELSAEAGALYTELSVNAAVMAYCDFLQAAAKLSAATRSNEPEIVDRCALRLYSAHHPLLYLLIKDDIVNNDLVLGETNNCLIISGVNTGGKTVLLKLAGLSALLAMHGLHVPAGPDSQIGIFSGILADLGDDQSLSQSLSSYSGQIVIINDMLARANEQTLILLDEIIVGTNPRYGAALAQAILERLADTGAKLIVTTHYTELKELASVDSRFQNGSVSFDLETLCPTYTLRIGLPGVSYSLEIARLYGMDEPVLARAVELLDNREFSVEALIEKIQTYQQQLEDERKNLAALKMELDQTRSAYGEKEDRLTRRIEDLKYDRGVEFLDEIKRYRQEIADKIRQLASADGRTAGRIQKEITAIGDTLSAELDAMRSRSLAMKYAPFDGSHAGIGDTVFISPINKTGILQGIDAHKKMAEVVIGNSIRSRFAFSDLFLMPESGHKRNGGPVPRQETSPAVKNVSIPITIQTHFNTIDLRGKRVDEAITIMEGNFDRMVRQGIRTAVVIHGHGTGAIKQAVRANLKFSSYIVESRPGDYGEGGDGVTIVRLRD